MTSTRIHAIIDINDGSSLSRLALNNFAIALPLFIIALIVAMVAALFVFLVTASPVARIGLVLASLGTRLHLTALAIVHGTCGRVARLRFRQRGTRVPTVLGWRGHCAGMRL